ncbi:DNA-binding protein [Candidatus Nitrosotenuis uzonensis]|nr:DNA-binding protein [Candidatus Nitrosotenuis uzonensis]
MISMGETTEELRVAEKRTEPYIYHVRNEPVMQAALDVFTIINKHGKGMLLAKGGSIPSAVAIANILVEKMLNRVCTIEHILLDSENEFGKRMISTIEILIVKN